MCSSGRACSSVLSCVVLTRWHQYLKPAFCTSLAGALQRLPLSLGLPYPHPHIQNVEAFTSLLGQEIVSSYHHHTHRMSTSTSPSNSPKIPTSLQNGSASRTSEQPSPRESYNQVPRSEANLQQQQFQQKTMRLQLDLTNSSETLDTSEVAQRVRELLSIHNIGQRLFAKSVLGLSQGTVSELLSKPKAWEKLTEKGRESYRKMHSWACNEENVMLLKSLTPKKGK